MFLLPENERERKDFPIGTFIRGYFPDAIAALARASKLAGDKHHPGEPMHWERPKSNDHADCMMRHFLEMGGVDDDGQLHTVKMAWRALALAQLELEALHKETPQHVKEAASDPGPIRPISQLLRGGKAEWQPGYPQVVNFTPACDDRCAHYAFGYHYGGCPAKPAEDSAGADGHNGD